MPVVAMLLAMVLCASGAAAQQAGSSTDASGASGASGADEQGHPDDQAVDAGADAGADAKAKAAAAAEDHHGGASGESDSATEPETAGPAEDGIGPAVGADAEGQDGAELEGAEALDDVDPAHAELEAATGAADETPIADAAREQRRAAFERQLSHVRQERAAVSYTLPWIMTGVGAAALVTGISVGLVQVLGCDDGACRGSLVSGWGAITGGALTIGGLAWLRVVDEERAEIDSRRYHIEDELQQLRWEQARLPLGEAGGPRLGARVRLSF